MQTIEARQPELLRTHMAPPGQRMHLKSILTLAIAARLGVIWVVLSKYPGNWLYSGALDLGFMAQAWNSGHGLSSPFGGSTGPTALVTPGYPAVIAVIFHLFGNNSLASAAAVMGLQATFSVLTIALMMRVAHKVFGAPTADLAGAFWALSLPIIWLPAVFWYVSLSALFVITTIALALWSVEQAGKGWLLIGVFSGVVMLVNPTLILVMLPAFSWAAYQTRSTSHYRPLTALLIMSLMIVPWSIRNARDFHTFIPLRSTFGYELWQGNRIGADGIFNDRLYPTNNQEEYTDYASKGEVAYMKEKSRLAHAYIDSHPREFAIVTAKRVSRFWDGTGDKTTSAVIALHIILTSVLGVLGLVSLFRLRKRIELLFLLPMLFFPLPYYITDAKSQYRLELDPLMTILGAYAIIRFDAYLKSRRSRAIA